MPAIRWSEAELQAPETMIMTRITDEQRQALSAHQGSPVPAEDDQTHRRYFIYSEDLHEQAMQALREREDYASIARGIQQMEAGEGRPLAEADAAMREQLRFPPRQ
jgi:hypothetical protein